MNHKTNLGCQVTNTAAAIIYCGFVTYGELDCFAHVKSSTFANYLAKNVILFPVDICDENLQENLLALIQCLISEKQNFWLSGKIAFSEPTNPIFVVYKTFSCYKTVYSSLSESKFKTKLCTLPMHACNLTPGKKQSQIDNHWTNPSSCSICAAVWFFYEVRWSQNIYALWLIYLDIIM